MRQLTRDEGSYMPNGKMLCLLKYKAIETVSPLRAITIFDWPLGRSESASPSFYLRAPGLRMELFSRRRWRLVSAQLSNKVGYCPSCTVSIVLVFNKHYSLPLGQIRAFLSLLLLKSSLADLSLFGTGHCCGCGCNVHHSLQVELLVRKVSSRPLLEPPSILWSFACVISIGKTFASSSSPYSPSFKFSFEAVRKDEQAAAN